jgi:eukaryotic-like serine/threonine-protein kinase
VHGLRPGDPERIGGYTLLGRIGSGAMGAVYLALSRGGRPIAIKVVRAELGDDPGFRERFRREVEAVRSVGGFWTAAVVDADLDAAQPWLATEYVPGPSLQEAVCSRGPLPVDAVRYLAAGLAEGLAAIHAAGVVHRDLKPANVLIGANGPRVIDFGISRALAGSTLTAAGHLLGTPGYLSPEQISGGPVGPASDVYALGGLLVFAATGRGPFGDGSASSLLDRARRADPDLGAVPPPLHDLVSACLQRDSSLRPAPAGVLAALGFPAAVGGNAWPPAVNDLIEGYCATLLATAGPNAVAVAGPAPALTRPYTVPPPFLAVPPAPAPTRPYGAPPWSAIAPGPPNAQLALPAPGAHPAQRAGPMPVVKPALLAGAGPVRQPSPGSGAVTFRSARPAAALRAGACGVLALLAAQTADPETGAASATVRLLAFVAFVWLAVLAVRWLLRAARPRTAVEVAPGGITLRRGRSNWHLPWSAVARVRLVDSARRPTLVVWPVVGTPVPPAFAAVKHRYYGGVKVLPVARGQLAKRRLREILELRAALAWYGRRAYDPSP